MEAAADGGNMRLSETPRNAERLTRAVLDLGCRLANGPSAECVSPLDSPQH